MAGSNAIGTGAVVLTANADKLASGLDKAAKDVGKFADKADKAASKGGKKGGITGLLFSDSNIVGGVVGAAAKVGFEAIGKAVGFVADVFGNLQERAAKVRLAPDVRAGVMSADRSVRQLSNTFDTLLLTAVAKLAPLMERFTPAVEAAMFVSEALFEAVVDGVGDVLTEIGKWIDSTTTLGVTTNDSGEVMFKVFKVVGKAVAWVWDTVKAGAGVIAYVAGTITEGFGIVVSVIGEAVDMLAKLAAELPDAIRPDWIQGAADSVKGWGGEIEKAGDKMANWGKGAIRGWGQSAAQVGSWVDQIQAKFNDRVKVPMNADPMKLAGAFGRESKEAYSITAKYQTESSGLNLNSPERKQFEATKAVERAVMQVADLLRGATPLRVV